MSLNMFGGMFGNLFNSSAADNERRKAQTFMRNFPDWENYKPQIMGILNENPYLPYEEAYMLAKGVDMGRVKIGGQEFDPANISGKKLADIGRWAVAGKKLVDDKARKEGDYTDIGWLDMRIEEICRRGKL